MGAVAVTRTFCICGNQFDTHQEDGLIIPSNKYGQLWFCPEHKEDKTGFMKHIWKYKKQGGKA